MRCVKCAGVEMVLAVLQSTLALKRQMNSSWNVMVGTTKKSKETKSLL